MSDKGRGQVTINGVSHTISPNALFYDGSQKIKMKAGSELLYVAEDHKPHLVLAMWVGETPYDVLSMDFIVKSLKKDRDIEVLIERWPTDPVCQSSCSKNYSLGALLMRCADGVTTEIKCIGRTIQACTEYLAHRPNECVLHEVEKSGENYYYLGLMG